MLVEISHQRLPHQREKAAEETKRNNGLFGVGQIYLQRLAAKIAQGS